MSDLIEAVAHIKQITPEGVDWNRDDLRAYIGFFPGQATTILNAVASGELVPAGNYAELLELVAKADAVLRGTGIRLDAAEAEVATLRAELDAARGAGEAAGVGTVGSGPISGGNSVWCIPHLAGILARTRIKPWDSISKP